jgi:hypothetical protein
MEGNMETNTTIHGVTFKVSHRSRKQNRMYIPMSMILRISYHIKNQRWTTLISWKLSFWTIQNYSGNTRLHTVLATTLKGQDNRSAHNTVVIGQFSTQG